MPSAAVPSSCAGPEAAAGAARGGILRGVGAGHSAYGANAAATLCGILAGVVVYFVLVIALRIFRAEDLRGMPHGEKIIHLLHLR